MFGRVARTYLSFHDIIAHFYLLTINSTSLTKTELFQNDH